MGKHRHAGRGTPPMPGLRERVHYNSHRKSGPKTPVRSKVLAAVVATGAFSAIGQPFADAGADDHVGPVRPLSARSDLRDAVNGTMHQPAKVELMKPHAPTGSAGEVRKLDKSVEMQRARAEVDEAASKEREAAEWKARFVKPAEGTYTSGFGSRWGTSHYGVDIANSIGTAIGAVTAGEVVDAGPASGFGQWVRLQHDDGTMTVYGHVNTIDVSVGQQVKAGEKIATMGNEGQSTGPHLHFEVLQGGEKINPEPWLAECGISL